MTILTAKLNWLAFALDRFLTPTHLKIVAIFLFLILPISEVVVMFSGSGYYAVGGGIKGVDFLIFYNAGKLANQGVAVGAYNYRQMLISIYQQLGEPLPNAASLPDFATSWPIYLYSPPFTVIFALLARLPFGVALAIWLLAGLAALLLAVRLLWRSLPYLKRQPYWLVAMLGLGFWPLNIVFSNGQNSCFTLLVYVVALYLTQPYAYPLRLPGHSRGAASLPPTPAGGFLLSRDWLAGLIATILTLQKPQLLIGLALIWLLTLNWRAIGGLLASTATACVLTLLVLPPAMFPAWVGNLLAFSSAGPEAPIPPTDVTMRTLLHDLLPFAKGAANLLYYAYFGAALVALVLAVRRLNAAPISAVRRHYWLYTLAALFSVASANYLLIYDLTLLLLPVLLLFALFDQPGEASHVRLKLLTVFLYTGLTVCHFVGLATGVQLAVWVVFIYVGCICWTFVKDTQEAYDAVPAL